jgi:hypothetical protein
VEDPEQPPKQPATGAVPAPVSRTGGFTDRDRSLLVVDADLREASQCKHVTMDASHEYPAQGRSLRWSTLGAGPGLLDRLVVDHDDPLILEQVSGLR